jgi:hypothetical protein
VHAALTSRCTGTGSLPEPSGRTPIGREGGGHAPFYARGLFASPLMTGGGSNGVLARCVRHVGAALALLDQPLRWALGGRLGTATTYEVPPNAQARYSDVGGKLWMMSSALCRLPVDMQC